MFLTKGYRLYQTKEEAYQHLSKLKQDDDTLENCKKAFDSFILSESEPYMPDDGSSLPRLFWGNSPRAEFYLDENNEIQYLTTVDTFSCAKDVPHDFEAIRARAKELDAQESSNFKNKKQLQAEQLIIGLLVIMKRYDEAIALLKKLGEITDRAALSSYYSMQLSPYYEEERRLGLLLLAYYYDKKRLSQIQFLKGYKDILAKKEKERVLQDELLQYPALLKAYHRILDKFPNFKEALDDSFTEPAVSYGRYYYDSEPSLLSVDMLESDPSLLEAVLAKCNPNAYPFTALRPDDKRIKTLKEDLGDDSDRLKDILRNYFYSEYGSGKRSSGLKFRIASAKRFISYLGFDDRISIIELFDGFPDKMMQNALLAEFMDE